MELKFVSPIAFRHLSHSFSEIRTTAEAYFRIIVMDACIAGIKSLRPEATRSTRTALHNNRAGLVSESGDN